MIGRLPYFFRRALRNMLQRDGLEKPEYHAYDKLFSLP